MQEKAASYLAVLEAVETGAAKYEHLTVIQQLSILLNPMALAAAVRVQSVFRGQKIRKEAASHIGGPAIGLMEAHRKLMQKEACDDRERTTLSCFMRVWSKCTAFRHLGW